MNNTHAASSSQMGIRRIDGMGASWVTQGVEAWMYGRVAGTSVQSVVNGTDGGENESRI